jgi:hypothetical protein
MRHEVHCPGQERSKVFEEWQGSELQCQLQTVETVDERAKALIAYQNAMFAAAYCRKENGRCEGCGS